VTEPRYNCCSTRVMVGAFTSQHREKEPIRYLDASIPVSTRVSGGGGLGMAGNVVFGGIIGGGVDIASGALYDHFPNPVALILTPIDPNNPAPVFTPSPPPVGPVISMAEPQPQRLRYPLSK